MPFSSSRPSIKGKALLRFPARVDEGPGISVTRANGVYTFGLDYESLADNGSIADPSNHSVAVWNISEEQFEEVRLDDLNTSTTGDVRTPRGDADYNILNTDSYVALTAALTTDRTFTLPAANAVSGGKRITVHDEGLGITAANTLIFATTGADTINGAATFILDVAGAGVEIRSDGTSAWSIRLISSAQIAALAVGTAALAAGAVTTAKLSTTVVHGLTAVAPATGDYVAIADASDSNLNKKSLVSDVLALRTLQTRQVFTADGTWTKPAGCRSVLVRVQGGGGGGGGSTNTANTASGGGGGGGYVEELIPSGLGATEVITVGAGGTAGANTGGDGGTGGTSSFGSFCQATGGVGGVGATAAGVVAGGAGGVGSGGDIAITGNGGGLGVGVASAISPGAGGGGHFQGAGLAPPAAVAASAGTRGGGGSGVGVNSTGAAVGGVGGAGLIIVEEFY